MILIAYEHRFDPLLDQFVYRITYEDETGTMTQITFLDETQTRDFIKNNNWENVRPV